MKAGTIGKCPDIEHIELSDMLIFGKNGFAVLIDENAFSKFEEVINNHREIETVFLVTDYDVNYRSMVKSFPNKTTYQLYRDYLDNFRINHGRN